MKAHHSTSYHQSKRILRGLTLVVVGIAFLLHRLGYADFHQFWLFGPAFIAIWGVHRLAHYRQPSDMTRGLFQLALAGWISACMLHWWDFSFQTSWPYLLISYGLAVAVSGLFGQSRRDLNAQTQYTPDH